jgi:hypothetical protein
MSVVCCQVEVSATGRSLVQRTPTEGGVSECDQGTSQRRPRPTGGLSNHKTTTTKNTTTAQATVVICVTGAIL